MSDVFSSKTLGLWIIIFGVGLAAILLTAAIQISFNRDLPFMSEFFNLLEWGGTGGTARNIISDGVAPRIPQAIGANRNPEVSTQAPMSMAHSDKASRIPKDIEVR